jgi:acetoin utilization deacetylase AcuC-like enzyme
MGFCLFNNVAIAARYALNNLATSRILICDFDVHHGNGTAEIFYSDPRVLYFSTHQYPFYPGTGSMEDIGVGEGQGTTVNVPLPAGCGDEEYVRVFEEVLVPVTQHFKPQIILVSTGFDPHFTDPIGGMQVSIKGFYRMTSILNQLARESCEGRMVFSLEGGYDLRAISHSVKAVLDVLLNREFSEEEDFRPQASPSIGPQLERIKQIHHLGGSL